MKKTNRLLFMLAVVLTAFVGLKNVNADTIFSPDATCGDFPKDGDALITNCSSSGDESDLFDVAVMTWYKGDLYESSSDTPGESVGTTGVYESGYKYYLELKFTPKTGNEIADDTNFNIIGLSDGTVVSSAPNGEYIVIFEFVVHHIVHFETYGGTPIADFVEDEWCSFDIDAIDNPVKDGYTFLGWYEDSDFEYNYWGSCLDESITLYAKFVETSKIINNINVTLQGPTIGQVITSGSYTDPEWGAVVFQQNPRPTATVPNDVNYAVDSASWVQGLCDMEHEIYLCDEYFDGEIEEDTYYYAEIGVEAKEGYALNPDVTIKVNGEDPEEVFAVYGSTYTRFIAKVKSQEASATMITANKTSVDFGETFAGLDNDAYFALGQKVIFTNTGVTTVKFSIYNPTDKGMGSTGFDSNREVAPGETMEITLIPHPSYIFSKDPGVYNGTYVITAINVEDASDTYSVNVAGKIVVLEKDISKAAVSGITTQTYNGKQQRQEKLVVKLSGRTLVKDVDYQVLYSSLTNAGTVKMTIKGIGEYEGSLVKTFTRKKAKNTLTVKAYNKTVYYSKVKKAAQVVKPITIVKKQGTLTYTKMSGSSTKLLLNKTTGKVTVKKGTKKGKYKIKIKVYASGNTNYFSNYTIKTVYVTVK